MLGPDAAAHAVADGLRARHGAAEIVLTDSGTAALTLALRIAVRAGGGSIALPAYGCFDVATAALGVETPVLLYDLDPATLAPEPASLHAALERGARVVVVAHLYGIPVDVPALRDRSKAFGAWVIEDAAQGVGAAIGGRGCGGFGDLAVLSFGRGKGLTAGRGGALLLHDPRLGKAAAARGELLPARTSVNEPVSLLAQWALARPALYALPASLPFLGLGETIFRPPRPLRAMSSFALGVLGRTIHLVGPEVDRRRANARRLRAAIESGAEATPVAPPPGAEPGYLRLPVLVAEPARPRFLSAEARRLGIMPGYPGTLSTLPGFRGRLLDPDASYPGATRLARSLFTLPTHGQLAERDLIALERWLGKPQS